MDKEDIKEEVVANEECHDVLVKLEADDKPVTEESKAAIDSVGLNEAEGGGGDKSVLEDVKDELDATRGPDNGPTDSPKHLVSIVYIFLRMLKHHLFHYSSLWEMFI